MSPLEQLLAHLAGLACAEHEDGETGTLRCCELYCAAHGLPETCADLMAAASALDGALSAGIPRSVIRGETKLRDHFSAEYIEAQCAPNGRTP